jgi:hypothetical protein
VLSRHSDIVQKDVRVWVTTGDGDILIEQEPRTNSGTTSNNQQR